MKRISLANAKAHLSEVVDAVAAGEPVVITRRGKDVARIVPAEDRLVPVDVAALAELAESMPVQSDAAADFMSKLRRSTRY